MESELFVKRITLEANLEKLAGKINAAEWDEGNELPEGEYTAQSLAWYLQREGTFFFACFAGSELAGMVSRPSFCRAPTENTARSMLTSSIQRSTIEGMESPRP